MNFKVDDLNCSISISCGRFGFRLSGKVMPLPNDFHSIGFEVLQDEGSDEIQSSISFGGNSFEGLDGFFVAKGAEVAYRLSVKYAVLAKQIQNDPCNANYIVNALKEGDIESARILIAMSNNLIGRPAKLLDESHVKYHCVFDAIVKSEPFLSLISAYENTESNDPAIILKKKTVQSLNIKSGVRFENLVSETEAVQSGDESFVKWRRETVVKSLRELHHSDSSKSAKDWL